MTIRAGTWLVTIAAIGAFFALENKAAEPRFVVGALAAAGALGACLIGIPYARQWGGTARDAAWIVAVMGGMFLLPVLPLAVDDGLPSVFLGGPVIYAFLFGSLARTQGRYLFTDRKIPELEGEPRGAILDVLARAGLKPLSILVAKLDSYNAFVMGLRTCVLLIDRRVSRELPPQELAALVAHEAGHVRRGDTLLYLGFPALLVCASGLLAAAGQWPAVAFPVAVSLVFGTLPAVLQTAELGADRFAASLVGAEPVGRMLNLIHADRTALFDRAASTPFFVPFLSHPPLDLRRARLGLPHRPISAVYRAGLALRTALAATPAVLLLAAGDGAFTWIWGLSLLTATLYLGARVRVWIAARRSYQITASGFGREPRSGRIVWLFLLPVLILAAGLFFAPRNLRGLTVFLSLLVLVFLLRRTGRRAGGKRKEISGLPQTLRGPVVEAMASISEGQPERGLATLDAVEGRHGADAWFRTAKGTCLLFLARGAEAVDYLEKASASDAAFVLPRVNLMFLMLLSGNLARAKELAAEVSRLAPEDPLGWRLRGRVHLAAGEPEEARKAFDTVGALKPSDAEGLAGSALAAMDIKADPSEIEKLLERAAEAGPRLAPVLAAQSRWLHRQGRPAEAAERFRDALRQLDPPDLKIWIPYYRAEAARWGIALPDEGSVPQR